MAENDDESREEDKSRDDESTEGEDSEGEKKGLLKSLISKVASLSLIIKIAVGVLLLLLLAGGAYFFFMSEDEVVETEAIEEVVDAMASDENKDEIVVDVDNAETEADSVSEDSDSISPASASFIDFLKFLILLPNALPISGSFPAPKMIMIITKMIINSGKPMPIITRSP